MAQPVIVTPCGVPGVAVAGAGSPDYLEKVDQVMGMNRPPNVTQWLPYGVALTNQATQNIAALAVRWLVTNAKGQVVPFTVSCMMFDQPKQQLLPGKTVIAVPIAVAGATPHPPASPTRLIEFQRAERIQVAVDGVVFASGQFAGPDNGKSYEEFVAETTIPAHVASTILAMKEAGEPIRTVAAWLETNSKPQTGGRAAQVTARTSRILLDGYKKGGEALLYEVAQGYEKAPAIRIYR